MSKILGIVGSPRRGGNTHLLVSEALDEAQRHGAGVECVLLGDLAIRECDGCHVCWQAKPCSKADDMIDLYAKIIDCDVLVFGTPVYWYGPTALMKAFIDRFVYFNCPANRAGVAGKSAAVVVPFEEQADETAAGTVAFFDKCLQYLQMNLVGRLIVPGVTERGEVGALPDVMARARDLGRALAGGPA